MLRLLLFPFAILYDLVTRVRNHFYNIGQKPSFRFDTPVISVGNLNAGGSGKTPMIEYLVRLLTKQSEVATLSRGYGRRTRGFRIASSDDNATTIGDEPLQLFRKFGSEVHVTVGEDRVFAIPNILQEFENTDVILLDDAFQHRAVNPHFSILLTEYDRPFTRDFLLPAGNLRESRRGASRADVVVVTKCPDGQFETDKITSDIKRYADDKPVFFSRIAYGDVIPFGGLKKPSGKLFLVTGIAHPGPLVKYIRSRFELVRHFEFADHHSFTESEINEIHFEASQVSDVFILTTEKDMVRLLAARDVNKYPWFFIPVHMEFVANGPDFDTAVQHQLKRD